MGSPLTDAWKVAQELHERINPSPTETDWYKASGFRNDMDRLVFDDWSDRVDRIKRGEVVLDADEGEARVLRWAAYFSVLRYQALAQILIKIYHLDMAQRQPRR